jgi:hypothetical protein
MAFYIDRARAGKTRFKAVDRLVVVVVESKERVVKYVLAFEYVLVGSIFVIVKSNYLSACAALLLLISIETTESAEFRDLSFIIIIIIVSDVRSRRSSIVDSSSALV